MAVTLDRLKETFWEIWEIFFFFTCEMGTIIFLVSGEGIIIYYLHCNSTKGWLG